MIGQHDERGQVLVRGAEAVAHPAAHAGKSGSVEAGGLEQRALRVDAGFPHHVVNERHFVDDGSERRDWLAELLAGVAVGFEIPHGFEPRTEAILKSFDVFAELGGLAVPLDEFRFEVEEVDVARAAGHEQLHDAFGLGGVMNAAIGPLRGVGEELFAAEERGECDAAEPAAGVKQEVATIHGSYLGPRPSRPLLTWERGRPGRFLEPTQPDRAGGTPALPG